LSASAELLHDHFIIIKADEEKFAASGCSIDKQFQFIKEVEKKYGLSLLNRLVIAYKEGNEIKTAHSSKVPQLLASGDLNENTIVYNVGAGTDTELATNFEIPLSKSWLAKFLIKA
ncbi:MAG: ABC transporter ATPase, partial [Bacteroidia bacterium]